jgi:hypothetical protein
MAIVRRPEWSFLVLTSRLKIQDEARFEAELELYYESRTLVHLS